jgi:hypothetical protein
MSITEEIPMAAKMLHPDSKGRIRLGSLAKSISSYAVHQEPNGTVILEPFVEIPLKEKWLFENTSALKKVRTGLKQAKNKDLIDKGGFSQFIHDEIE